MDKMNTSWFAIRALSLGLATMALTAQPVDAFCATCQVCEVGGDYYSCCVEDSPGYELCEVSYDGNWCGASGYYCS